MTFDPRGFGYQPGYNDPLSRPRGFPGMGAAIGGSMQFGPGPGGPSMSGMRLDPVTSGVYNPPAPGVSGAPERRGVGSYISGALDWLTDEEQGANRIGALTNAVGLGLNWVGARKDRAMYEEDREREMREEEERRERMRRATPYLGRLLGGG